MFPRLEHPAGWICARYKSLLLLLLLLYISLVFHYNMWMYAYYRLRQKSITYRSITWKVFYLQVIKYPSGYMIVSMKKRSSSKWKFDPALNLPLKLKLLLEFIYHIVNAEDYKLCLYFYFIKMILFWYHAP